MADSEKNDSVRKAELSLNAFVEHSRERGKKQFDVDIMDKGKVIDASPGKVTMEIDLGDEFSNNLGFLHGSAMNMLFDCYTAVAFNTQLPDWSPAMYRQMIPGGLSRTMNMTYLRPLMLPARVRVVAEVVSDGKLATFSRAKIIAPEDIEEKKPFATCEHHKIKPPFKKLRAKI